MNPVELVWNHLNLHVYIGYTLFLYTQILLQGQGHKAVKVLMLLARWT